MTLLERLDERWERMDGATATKIDRILKERREAADEIKRLQKELYMRTRSLEEELKRANRSVQTP